MINIKNVANTIANDGVAERPRKVGEQGEAFAQELMQAVAPVNQPAAQGPELTLDLSELGAELGKQQAILDAVLSGGANALAKAPVEAPVIVDVGVNPAGQDAPRGTRSALHESTIAKSELAQKSAAGMSTAAAVAGLKPWSMEWVFEGFEKQRPELNPLISDSGKQELPLNGKSVGSQLQTLFDISNDGGAEAPVNPEQPAVQGAPQGAVAPKGVMGGDAGLMLLQSESTDAAGLMGLLGLEGLNGSMEEVSVQSAAVRPEGDPKGKKGLTTQLSGSEFLSALNSVKAGAVKGAQSQLSGDSGNGGGQSGAGGARSQAQLKRPELKVVRGGMENGAVSEQSRFSELMAGSTLQQVRSAESSSAPKVVELSGQTAKGAMSRDRLSTDALLGLTGSIRNLGTQGAGEIRIRLKPEDLGELHLRVVTRGSEVGLQIQASDDRAMKVIEESIGFLKDSLAAQNLSLGKVEVAVAQSHGTGTGMGSESGNQQAQQGHHGSQDLASMMGQEKGQGNREQSEGWGRESAPADSAASRTRAAGAGWNASARTRAAAANGRLDVTA